MPGVYGEIPDDIGNTEHSPGIKTYKIKRRKRK